MIEVKNVTKKYGKFTAIDDISFTIKEGEIVGLLGPNGAGKSTTMNMITGFIEQTQGEIIIDGFDMLKKPKKAKREIGYMPEGVPLYTDLTVKEFVRYMAELKKVAKKEIKEKVEKIIKQTGLEEVQDKLIKKLSRGYKQRTSLAGALVGEPKILILDEPTVGLDPKQITEIRELIKELGKTHTVILSSHILSEVSQICNKVIIINKGKIIAIDTPQNLENKVSNNDNIYITIEDPENKIESVIKNIPEIKSAKLVKENDDGTKQYVIETQSAKEIIKENKDNKENEDKLKAEDEEVSIDKKEETEKSEEKTNKHDIRKKIFTEFAKEDITIYEMKKQDATLEDAFMQLIEGGKE